jgi:hypothetical protein
MRLRRIVVSAAIVCLGVGVAAAAQQKGVNPDARVLADYKKRIDAYMELRSRIQRGGPRLEPAKDPAKIQAARNELAAAIRSARADAAQGAIFTKEVAMLFRRLLAPETRGPRGTETREAIAEDAPAKVTLKVHASYPEGEPLPSVPANVLASLPRLPEGLEYRILHRHLILRDVDANLIVDVMPNAMP